MALLLLPSEGGHREAGQDKCPGQLLLHANQTLKALGALMAAAVVKGSCTMHAKPDLVAAALSLVWVGVGVKAGTDLEEEGDFLAGEEEDCLTKGIFVKCNSRTRRAGFACNLPRGLSAAPADDYQLLSRARVRSRDPLYRWTLPLPAPCSQVPLLPGLSFYCLCFSFFFFLAAPQHMEFSDQGSGWSCSCDLSHSCSSAGSLTHCAGLGSNLCPSAPEMLLILLRHSGNSPELSF